MKHRLLAVFSIVMLFSLSSYAIVFNEIMYDPLGLDDNAEWFEIYNEKNQSVDIQNWKFFEASTNHTITAVVKDYVLDPHEFAVVAEDAVNFLSLYPNYSGTLFDSSFSLSNTGEVLVLRNKTGQVQDNFTYSYLWGGEDNGFSIGLYKNVWQETVATPAAANKISEICDWKVSIGTDSLIFDNKGNFSWSLVVEKLLGDESAITIQRSIEDVNGKVVKSYTDLTHNITNRETLNYDPNLNPGTYLLNAQIIPACNDTNPSNDVDQELRAVREQKKEAASSITVDKIYDLGSDNKAKFGQLIRAKIIAYRGDTTKETVSVYIEGKDRVSKVFSFKISEPFTKQELTLPLQIFSNCKNEFDDGTYQVVAKGFDEEDKLPMKIFNNTDDLCVVEKADKKTVAKTSSAKAKETNASAITTSFTTSRSPVFNAQKPFAISTVLFESTQKKAENLIPYGLAIIMSLATIVLITFNKGLTQ